MERALEDARKLKESIESNTSSVGTDKDFIKLVQMKNIDPDLKETLILLHSNYKTEIIEYRLHLKETLSKMVDNQISLVRDLDDNSKRISDTNNAVDKYTKVIKTVFAVAIVGVVVFFFLAYLDNKAFQSAFGAIKELFNVTSSERTLVIQSPQSPQSQE